MDEKDAAIIRVVEQVVKEPSSRNIAAKIGLPPSTVHRRIKKLEAEGVIIGYRAVINYDKTDRPISARLLIQLRESTREKPRISKNVIMGQLRNFDNEIREITNIQGFTFDLSVTVRCKNIKELSLLSEALSSLEGIERVATAIIVEEFYI
jgi:DNA-binding Lrp family transcriptional regulator